MGRRTIYVGNAEDVAKTGGSVIWETPPQSGYVGGPYAEGKYQSLLWKDIHRIENESNMTAQQSIIFEAHILDVPNHRISEIYNIHPVVVCKTIKRVELIAEKVLNKGIITTLYEQCGGWAGISCVLARLMRG